MSILYRSLGVVIWLAWSITASAYPLEPIQKSGFTEWQAQHQKPTAPGDPLVLTATAPTDAVPNMVLLGPEQTRQLMDIMDTLKLQVNERGASMRVFTSGW
ncbi:MAG: hypothetical protein OHK0012_05060 [Synechococcales cyanobacterium]